MSGVLVLLPRDQYDREGRHTTARGKHENRRKLLHRKTEGGFIRKFPIDIPKWLH
jgi:hypothetical protein